jgi:uncharacterized phage protein (TIGR02218 family)
LTPCWKIVRRDGIELGFSGHDRDLTYNGLLYESAHGFSQTAMSSDASLSVDNMDVMGILDSDKITIEDIRNRLYDLASVYVFLVNYKDLSMGEVPLRRGWFGEAQLSDNGEYTIELRGLMQALMHSAIEVYTPECRADFGDTRCKKDLVALTQSGVVESVINSLIFRVTGLTDPTHGWVGGTIKMTSGPNAGNVMEIISYTPVAGTDPTLAEIEIFDNFHFPIIAADTFEAWPGCPKTPEACKLYENYINYRGEPDVPGQDEYLNYPDAN